MVAPARSGEAGVYAAQEAPFGSALTLLRAKDNGNAGCTAEVAVPFEVTDPKLLLLTASAVVGCSQPRERTSRAPTTKHKRIRQSKSIWFGRSSGLTAPAGAKSLTLRLIHRLPLPVTVTLRRRLLVCTLTPFRSTRWFLATLGGSVWLALFLPLLTTPLCVRPTLVVVALVSLLARFLLPFLPSRATVGAQAV